MKVKQLLAFNCRVVGEKIYAEEPLQGIFTYEITNILTDCNGVIYVVAKCENCNHSPACELKLELKGGRLEYVEMVNEDMDDPKYYHHCDNTFFFCLEDARIHRAKRNIELIKDRISKMHMSLAVLEQKLKHNEELILNMTKETEDES